MEKYGCKHTAATDRSLLKKNKLSVLFIIQKEQYLIYRERTVPLKSST
ncbi:hypothetical protein Mpsy_0329 [Methanolobus psychrophilus R15]|nr:hypothetical protein Mpsy_0329 [Methanolobus psychrophilus R15]